MERVVLLAHFLLCHVQTENLQLFGNFIYFAASRFHVGRHVEGRMCGLRAILHYVNTPPFSVIYQNPDLQLSFISYQ